MDDSYVRVTITVAEHGQELENGERLMEGFMEAHPETGPSVSQNVREGTLSVTFGVEEQDVNDALDLAKGIFLAGANASGLRPSRIVNVEATLVTPEEAETAEEREPVPA